jgi:hypothetical protein
VVFALEDGDNLDAAVTSMPTGTFTLALEAGADVTMRANQHEGATAITGTGNETIRVVPNPSEIGGDIVINADPDIATYRFPDGFRDFFMHPGNLGVDIGSGTCGASPEGGIRSVIVGDLAPTGVFCNIREVRVSDGADLTSVRPGPLESPGAPGAGSIAGIYSFIGDDPATVSMTVAQHEAVFGLDNFETRSGDIVELFVAGTATNTTAKSDEIIYVLRDAGITLTLDTSTPATSVTAEANGTVVLDDVTLTGTIIGTGATLGLTVQGTTDVTDATLTDVNTVTVQSGASLTILAQQAGDLPITGPGAVVLTGLAGSDADISGVTVSGSVTLALGAADAALADGFEFGDRACSVTSDGTRELDITQVTEPLGNSVSFALDAGVTLRLTAEQADGLTVTGDGNVIVTGLDGSNADLSGVSVDGSVTLDLGAADAALIADFSFADRAYSVMSDGTHELDITQVAAPLGSGVSFALDAGVTLRLTAEQADGLTVTGGGNVIVTGLGGSSADISELTVDGTVSLDAGNPNPVLDEAFTFGARAYAVIGVGTLDITDVTDVGMVAGLDVSSDSVLAALSAQVAMIGIDKITGAGMLRKVAPDGGGTLDASGAGLASVVLVGGAGADTFVFSDGVAIEGFDGNLDRLDVRDLDLGVSFSDLNFSLAGDGSVEAQTTDPIAEWFYARVFFSDGGTPAEVTAYVVVSDFPVTGDFEFGWLFETSMSTGPSYMLSWALGNYAGDPAAAAFSTTLVADIGELSEAGSLTANVTDLTDVLIFRVESEKFDLSDDRLVELTISLEDVPDPGVGSFAIAGNGDTTVSFDGSTVTLLGISPGDVTDDWFIFS